MNRQEKKTVSKMIKIYCAAKHGTRGALCAHCTDLCEYACKRLQNCIYNENKPTCKHCSTHCYAPAMRSEMKKVMHFAGPRMMFHYPILAIKHIWKNWMNKTN